MSANDFLSFFIRNRLRFLLLKLFDLNLLSRVEQTLALPFHASCFLFLESSVEQRMQPLLTHHPRSWGASAAIGS
jgi:hypothetical protein